MLVLSAERRVSISEADPCLAEPSPTAVNLTRWNSSFCADSILISQLFLITATSSIGLPTLIETR